MPLCGVSSLPYLSRVWVSLACVVLTDGPHCTLTDWFGDLKAVLNDKQSAYNRSGQNADGEQLPKLNFVAGRLDV